MIACAVSSPENSPEISKLERELAIESIQPMDAPVSAVVAPQRVSTLLVGAFAAIALLLAAVGLYGLLAYTIAQRQREMAVRIALGADRHTVIGMVMGQGARLVAIGLIAGLIGSLGLTRLMTSLLYQTSPYDLVTFITVPAVLAVVAFIACALPAWRAARVDPIAALRAESSAVMRHVIRISWSGVGRRGPRERRAGVRVPRAAAARGARVWGGAPREEEEDVCVRP